MNCRPGDLARCVGLPEVLRAANDRFVRLSNSPAVMLDGDWTWALAEPMEIVLLGNCTQGGVKFWIGETVVVTELQDEYLRPIRDQPGEDEILRIAGRPVTDRSPVEA